VPASPRWIGAAIGAALFVIYLTNVRAITSGDNIPTRLLPFSLLREGNLTLDEFPRLRANGRLLYFVRESNGHLYAATSVMLPFIIAPLYVAPAWVLSAYDIPYDDVRAQLIIDGMERISAAAITALSACFLFLTFRRLVSTRWAVALTMIYALGTNTWVVSSQALWPHGFSELALAVITWLFLSPALSATAMALAGLTAAIAVANRPQMLPFAVLAFVYVWNHRRRAVVAFAAIPISVGVLLVAYNLTVFRALAGAYQTFDHFSNPLFTGLGGLLFSPNRGLFVFTPILVFAVWGAIQAWRTRPHPWLRYLVIGLALHLVLYAKFDEWWAGYTFGPRYMTDVLPVLCLLLVYGLVPLWRNPAVRLLAVALAVYGVGVQIIGVYWDNDDWNRRPIPLELRPQRVWDWSDLQMVRALRGGWHGSELWPIVFTAFRDPVPARLQALTPEDLASAYAIVRAPQRLRRGVRDWAVVAVTNRGTRAWPAFSGDFDVRDTIVLVVRWWAGGQPIPGAGDVLKLPRNISPGTAAEVAVPLLAPFRPGAYEVEVRIAQALDGSEGISSPDAHRFPLQVE
jgi:hypothetical protein